MESALPSAETEDPPLSFRSGVWDYFGFRVKYDPDCRRVVDKNTTVCRKCNTMLSYVGGNTTNADIIPELKQVEPDRNNKQHTCYRLYLGHLDSH